MLRSATMVAIFVVIAMPSVTQGDQPAQQVATKSTLRNGCQQLYTQHQFHHYAGRVYRRKVVTMKSRIQMRIMMRCQHSPRAERKMRKTHKVLRVTRQIRLEIAALTPYGPCYGGMWAVPCPIIARESKGRWWVLNTWTQGVACLRRACGPYQFKGWNVPWPVRTLRDKLAHHLEAAKLWNGGRGCSNWSC